MRPVVWVADVEHPAPEYRPYAPMVIVDVHTEFLPAAGYRYPDEHLFHHEGNVVGGHRVVEWTKENGLREVK